MNSFLAAVTRTVVENCDPDFVMLFGSWAKDSADVHSDVDLLVVGPFASSRRLRGRDLYGELRRFPLRFDLHLLTPAELSAGVTRRYGYLDTMRSTGRCLYRRPGVNPAEFGFRNSCGDDSAGLD